ncbi:hypothetical protein [Clavibacter tessellarius]|uniref:hypothetical protein n=1 Tax=Clavibacter tessellarius TaxID=31965 RepID=UPI00325612C0
MSDTVRAVLLLECYVTVTLLAPLLLGRLPLVAQRPVAMLAAWHGFLVTAVLSLGSGLGLLIHQGVAMQAGADAERVAVVVPLAYAAAGVLGILLFRIVEEGGRVVRDARHRAGEVATLLLASRPYRVAGRDARLVESDVPLAALSPATGVILLTTEARARLDDDEPRRGHRARDRAPGAAARAGRAARPGVPRDPPGAAREPAPRAVHHHRHRVHRRRPRRPGRRARHRRGRPREAGSRGRPLGPPRRPHAPPPRRAPGRAADAVRGRVRAPGAAAADRAAAGPLMKSADPVR